MKIIGITGSSGSGKTTATEILSKKQNIGVVYSDEVVRDLSIPGTEYMKAIKNDLGEEFFETGGNLNKKILADAIYNDENILKKLNKLTFNYVVKEILNRANNMKDKEIVVIDVPLLFESGMDKVCDYTVSLIANKDLKIKRICERDNISIETAEKRLNIQPDDDFYIEKSDYIIENNSNTDLEKELEKYFKEILSEGF